MNKFLVFLKTYLTLLCLFNQSFKIIDELSSDVSSHQYQNPTIFSVSSLYASENCFNFSVAHLDEAVILDYFIVKKKWYMKYICSVICSRKMVGDCLGT